MWRLFVAVGRFVSINADKTVPFVCTCDHMSYENASHSQVLNRMEKVCLRFSFPHCPLMLYLKKTKNYIHTTFNETRTNGNCRNKDTAPPPRTKLTELRMKLIPEWSPAFGLMKLKWQIPLNGGFKHTPE